MASACQEHNFCHGNRCQIQNVRIQGETGDHHGSRDRTLIDVPRSQIEAKTRNNETSRDGNCAGEATAPKRIVHDERETYYVKHGQPHSAKLIVTRRARIDDAAADIQMRLGIAVVENISALKAPKRSTKD